MFEPSVGIRQAASVRSAIYFFCESMFLIFARGSILSLLLSGPIFGAESIKISRLESSFTVVTVKDVSNTSRDILIDKVWQETFDGNSRYVVGFYSKFNEPVAAREFWQLIPVISGEGDLKIYEWNSADCNLMHSQLRTDQDGHVSLLVSMRSAPDGRATIRPQSEPSEQRILIFKIFENDKSIPGLGRIFFKQTKTFLSQEKLCTSGEIDTYFEKLNGD